MTDATQADRAVYEKLEDFVFNDFTGAGLDPDAIDVITAHRQQAETDTAERIAAWLDNLDAWGSRTTARIRRGDWKDKP